MANGRLLKGIGSAPQLAWHINPKELFCGPSGSNRGLGHSSRLFGDGSIRQSGSGVLHQQSGRHEVLVSVDRHGPLVGAGSNALLHDFGSLSSGQVQRVGRQSVPPVQSAGLASIIRRHSGPLPTMGSPGYRPLCLPPIGGGAAVRSPTSARSPHRLHRCFFPTLQLRTGLGLSSSSSDAPFSSTTQLRQRKVHCDAPRWDKVFWRPDLKRRAIAPPALLRDLEMNLLDLATGCPPPRAVDLRLEAWLVRDGLLA